MTHRGTFVRSPMFWRSRPALNETALDRMANKWRNVLCAVNEPSRDGLLGQKLACAGLKSEGECRENV
jgi:hypothetical protein